MDMEWLIDLMVTEITDVDTAMDMDVVLEWVTTAVTTGVVLAEEIAVVDKK